MPPGRVSATQTFVFDRPVGIYANCHLYSANTSTLTQVRREPQWGPGNHSRAALSQPHSVGAEIETWRGPGCGVPLTIRLESLGERVRSVVSSFCSGIGRKIALCIQYLRSERNHLEHLFTIFETWRRIHHETWRWWGPKQRGARKLPLNGSVLAYTSTFIF